MESEPPLTVKRLFTEVPHSPMGLRPHFNALVASGWISLAAPAGDARVKLVRPTAMLIDRFEQLSRALEAVVIDCRQHQVITEVAPRRHLHPVPFVSAAGSQGIPAVFQKLRHPLY